MTQPPQGSNDPLTQTLVQITVIIPVALKVFEAIYKITRRFRRKSSTDEFNVVKVIVDKDTELKDLRNRLLLRDAEVVDLERRVKQLAPLASETETLQEVNKSLTTYNENLQKENTELSMQVEALRKLPTRQIDPPDVLDAGDGKPTPL